MALRFNMLLKDAGLDPGEVRLLRHQTLLPDGRTPLDLWRSDRSAFDDYQSFQLNAQRQHFLRPWWACFLGMRDGRTLFAGIYSVGEPVRIDEPAIFAPTGEQIEAGSNDRYPLARSDHLSEYRGRLYIDWGGGASGKRAWKQKADLQEKRITELYPDKSEAAFPGLMQIALPLSQLMEAPPGWIERLSEARGVYLLTCPDTHESYVGSASGRDGFWQRWTGYGVDGHGGNVALIDRKRSDWTVSILQLAGSADTGDDILAMEALWKRKLMSREHGLNRN